MGEALPRGSFQKLGLNAGGLRTAFSSYSLHLSLHPSLHPSHHSLSSSLTTLRTDGTSRSLTVRKAEIRKEQGKDDEEGFVSFAKDWIIYDSKDWVQKYKYVLIERDLVRQQFDGGHTGLAFFKFPFAQGVERFVYRCAEVKIPEDKREEWYNEKEFESSRANRGKLRLVAKEAKHQENLGRHFQLEMSRIQAEAAEMARAFNRRVAGPPEMKLNFLDTH
eukprot:5168820-Prymnesium_polylepis.1